MFYKPEAIATADVAIARKHSVGGEKRLWVSKEPVVPVGELLFAADGSGVWTPDPITAIPSTGYDLQVKVARELDAESDVVLTVTGTDQDDQALVVNATLSAPSWVVNKGSDFAEGAAWDIKPSASGKRFKTITDVSATNGKRWSTLKLFALPSEASWKYIDMVEGVDPKVGIQPGHPIADQLDGSAEVTSGRSEASSLSITAKHRSVADGLLRFAGRDCTLRMELWKQGKIHVERLIFGGARLNVNPNFGDGDDEVKQAADGMFTDYFGFHAP